MKKLVVGIIIVVAVGGTLGLIKTLQIRALIASAGAFLPPPETVAHGAVRADQRRDRDGCRLMVNYKLGKPDAARIHTSIGGVKTVEKYLKANRAVLRD